MSGRLRTLLYMVTIDTAMTGAQQRTFDELLSIGTDRPTAPPGLAEELTETIRAGTAAALERWTERSMWLGKSQLEGIARCEGQVVADRAETRDYRLHPATAAGIVAHRAIQIAHTHPNRLIDDYVRAAISASQREEKFADFWQAGDLGVQSDLISTATSMTCAFLDSWPMLDPKWSPRFEESVQARIGSLTMSARIDLILGRPKPDGRQTMLLCDLKSSGLSPHHYDEASFYALVATLRTGVPPFRSLVYSLASGTWTEPDVDADRLREVAGRVVDGVNNLVEVLADQRTPTLRAGRHCSWCPRKDDCPAKAAWEDAGRPEDFAPLREAVVSLAPTTGDAVPVGVGAGRDDDADIFELD